MRNKPLLLKEELSRIFELMDIGFNPNILLESGGGGTTIAKSLMPGEGKTIDNLVTTLAKSENDLLTYSAKLASMAPSGTFDEIAQKIASDSGKPVDELTDQMVKDWIKTQPGLMDDLQAAATKIAKEAVEKEIADFNIQSIFDNLATNTGNASLKDFPQQFAGIIGIKVNDANKNTMGRYLDGMQKIVDEMPDSEAKLKMEEQIGGKRTQMDNLSGKASTVVTDASDDISSRIASAFETSFDSATGVFNANKFFTDIIDSLEKDGLIKFPKGVDKAQVAKMMTDRLQTLEMDLQKAAKAWEKTYADSVDKAKVIQTAIDKLKDQMKNAGGKNDDPWWKGWFGKGVDETNKISKEGNKLKPWEFAKALIKIHLIVAGGWVLFCGLKNVSDVTVTKTQEFTDQEFYDDLKNCLSGLAWEFVLGYGLIDLLFISDYKETDFEKWATDNKEALKITDYGYDSDVGGNYITKSNSPGEKILVNYDADKQTFVPEK
jgi:hypothetical protein